MTESVYIVYGKVLPRYVFCQYLIIIVEQQFNYWFCVICVLLTVLLLATEVNNNVFQLKLNINELLWHCHIYPNETLFIFNIYIWPIFSIHLREYFPKYKDIQSAGESLLWTNLLLSTHSAIGLCFKIDKDL